MKMAGVTMKRAGFTMKRAGLTMKRAGLRRVGGAYHEAEEERHGGEEVPDIVTVEEIQQKTVVVETA